LIKSLKTRRKMLSGPGDPECGAVRALERDALGARLTKDNMQGGDEGEGDAKRDAVRGDRLRPSPAEKYGTAAR
jgi:hypothetical protein